MSKSHNYDVLIIGSGVAGLSMALRLNPDIRVAILSKTKISDGSSLYAQGGIAAVMDSTDSLESHIEDTLKAGAGLCNPDVVRYTVEKGPEAINWLIENNVPFTLNDDNHPESGYHLTQEGGHSHRRVIHAADATGQAIENTLEQQVRTRDNIHIFENHIAIDIITANKLGRRNNKCYGAYVFNRKSRKTTATKQIPDGMRCAIY